MTLAMALIGVLFGVALSVTTALFCILSMDGHFRDNLMAAAEEARLRLTGRRRRGQVPAPGPMRSVEADARLRAVQEELKVTQRLMEQARGDRQAQVESAAKAAEEIAGLRASVAERDDKVAAFEMALRDAQAEASNLRDELAVRSAELARSNRELKDLETEMSLVESGAGMNSVSDEIARLRRERDELTARLARLLPPAAAVEKNIALML